ncbi:MAG: hypothetical protein ACKOXK_10850, partial [Chakrabartia sp.]
MANKVEDILDKIGQSLVFLQPDHVVATLLLVQIGDHVVSTDMFDDFGDDIRYRSFAHRSHDLKDL